MLNRLLIIVAFVFCISGAQSQITPDFFEFDSLAFYQHEIKTPDSVKRKMLMQLLPMKTEEDSLLAYYLPCQNEMRSEFPQMASLESHIHILNLNNDTIPDLSFNIFNWQCALLVNDFYFSDESSHSQVKTAHGILVDSKWNQQGIKSIKLLSLQDPNNSYFHLMEYHLIEGKFLLVNSIGIFSLKELKGISDWQKSYTKTKPVYIHSSPEKLSDKTEDKLLISDKEGPFKVKNGEYYLIKQEGEWSYILFQSETFKGDKGKKFYVAGWTKL